jgi:hypothetical protein
MRSNQSITFTPKPLRKLALAVALCAPVFAHAQSTAIGKDHVEMLDRYCSECHNQDDFSGGLSFDLLDTNNLLADAETWEAVLLKLKAGMMPPQGKESTTWKPRSTPHGSRAPISARLYCTG